MLKRNILSILLVCLLLIAVTTFPAIAAIKFMSLGAGPTGGTFYPVGVIFATTFQEELGGGDYRFNAHASGGSTENLEMLRTKEIKLGIAGSVIAADAYTGAGKYKDKAIKNIRFISALWPEAETFVYRKGIGIEKFADFKGKKIGVGAAGGSGTIYLPPIFEEIGGFTFDDISPQWLSDGDMAQAMQNRLIDAAYFGAGIPMAAVSQVYASQVSVDMIEFTEEDLAKVQKVAPYFTLLTVPKGMYSGQDRDIQVLGVKCSLLTEIDVDEDIVYKILEVLYIKRLDDIKKQHGALGTLSLEEAIKGLSGAPLHPGAVRFYRDHGVEVPDSLIPSEMK